MKDIRNWPVIAKIEDQNYRRLFMTFGNMGLLNDLRREAPEFFHDQPQEFCIAKSEVIDRELAADYKNDPDETEHSTRLDTASHHWQSSLEDLGVPVLCFHLAIESIAFSTATLYPPPDELLAQLPNKNQILGDLHGKEVTLQGVTMVVVDTCDSEKYITLARADHIDMSK